MSYEILPSSPKALAEAEKKLNNGQPKYPFNDLDIGQSFSAPLDDEGKWKSIRVCVYQHNARAKGKKEFIFIKHDDLKLVEVARIA